MRDVLPLAVILLTCIVQPAFAQRGESGGPAPQYPPTKSERLSGESSAGARAVKRNGKELPPNAGKFMKIDVPGPPDQSLWFRYYQAGEDAYAKNDKDKAKAYWIASLGALEKNPPTVAQGDMIFSVKLSGLEQYLTYNIFPQTTQEWSQYSERHDDEMQLRKEQVDVLYRLARINEKLVPAGDLLRTKSAERYSLARAEYEKLLKTAPKSKAQADDDAQTTDSEETSSGADKH